MRYLLIVLLLLSGTMYARSDIKKIKNFYQTKLVGVDYKADDGHIVEIIGKDQDAVDYGWYAMFAIKAYLDTYPNIQSMYSPSFNTLIANVNYIVVADRWTGGAGQHGFYNWNIPDAVFIKRDAGLDTTTPGTVYALAGSMIHEMGHCYQNNSRRVGRVEEHWPSALAYSISEFYDGRIDNYGRRYSFYGKYEYAIFNQ